MLLMPKTNLEAATVVAKKLRALISLLGHLHFDDTMIITASFGVAEVKDDDQKIEEIIERSDQLMYQAKLLGKNQVCTGLG